MIEKITIESQEINPIEVDYSEQKKIAIDSIDSFMESEKISIIYYIDDRVDIESSKPYFIGGISKIYNDGQSPQELDFIDWTIKPFQKFEENVLGLWEGYSTEEKKEYLRRLSIHIEDSNAIPALQIEELLGNRVKLFSPKEWVDDGYKVFKELEENHKVLCLFDIEFTDGAKLSDGRDGLDLTKQLLDSEHSPNCICGVFSHKFSIEEEDEKRIEFANEKSLPIKQFYTISKDRFAYDPKISAFAEGIKNLMLLPYVENLIEKSIESFTEAFTKSVDRIKAISPKTFNQIVQKSSLKEGVWEIITLFRLHGIISKEENFNILADPAKRKVFNNDISKIREIDLIETGYDSNLKNQQLIDLRNSELYLHGNIINTLHLPLTNGDIFEIKKKKYILLAQPCNLVVRAYEDDFGKRDYNYDTGILIPIREIPKDKFNITTSEEIKVAEPSEKVIIAYFPGFQIVSLNLLDLTVFNTDGNASIDFNNSELQNDVIHFPWLKRYDYIYKALHSYETKITEFKTVKESVIKAISQKQSEFQTAGTIPERKDVLKQEINILQSHFNSTEKNIFDITDLSKFKIDCTKIYDEKTRILDTTIKRVRHYKSPYSDDLLQKFMLYLSRNAFEHDFTNN